MKKQKPTELRMPHCQETEVAVIGSLIAKRIAYNEVCTLLSTDCFYDLTLQGYYEAIVQLVERGEQIDVLSVTHEVQVVARK